MNIAYTYYVYELSKSVGTRAAKNLVCIVCINFIRFYNCVKRVKKHLARITDLRCSLAVVNTYWQ